MSAPSSVVSDMPARVSFVVKMTTMMATMMTAMTTMMMTTQTNAVEFCNNQVFSATCEVGTVIDIESAFYGRLKLGPCATTDFGYIGCYRDVTTIARTRCSDRRKCRIKVPDETFDRLSPCNADLRNYLDIEYSCLPVATPSGPCNKTQPLPLTSSEGWISSLVTADTKCGTKDAPWAIETLPGQRIKLTLNDLSGVCGSNSSGRKPCRGTEPGKPCLAYALLTEPALERTFIVCSTVRRHYEAYLSIGHTLHIALVAPREYRFLFQYEVVGCPTVEPPKYGWVRRGDSVLTFGCTTTGDTWQLACVGRQWRGLVYNCSEPGEQPKGSKAALSSEVGIVIILGVSATTAFLILAAGILYIRRRTRDTQTRHVTPQLLYADGNCPSRQCYVANAGFRCTKRRSGAATDNLEEKSDYTCEMTVDSICGPKRKCSQPPSNPSPKPRPPQEGRMRYRVLGYPSNLNTFKPPRASRSDSDASREVHGFTACRYSRCRSRDAGDADDEVLDLKGTLLNTK